MNRVGGRSAAEYLDAVLVVARDDVARDRVPGDRARSRVRITPPMVIALLPSRKMPSAELPRAAVPDGFVPIEIVEESRCYSRR